MTVKGEDCGPIRAVDRIGGVGPGWRGSGAGGDLPGREWVLTEMGGPRKSLFSTERVTTDPHRVIPVMLSCDPHRMRLRSGGTEPRVKCPEADGGRPDRVICLTGVGEPG